MLTCGECKWNDEGKCIQSGFLGMKDEDYLIVKDTDDACDSFSEIE